MSEVCYQAFRLHPPNVHVDIKLTGGLHKHIFAADKYSAGQLKLVPYSASFSTVHVAEAKQPVGKDVCFDVKLKGGPGEIAGHVEERR